MRKLFVLLLLFCNSSVYADSKLTALTADTTAQATDLLYKVDNPGGTPTSRAIRLDNLLGQVAVSSLTATGITSGTYGSATQVSSVTVGNDGRLTGAANVPINISTTNLNATGTASATTFLRGDNTWGTPASGSSASTLGVSTNTVLVSSPTSRIDFSPPFKGALIGNSTAQISLDVSSVTLQGNSFNGASQLVQTTASGLIPNSLQDASSVTLQGQSVLSLSSATATYLQNSSASITYAFANNVLTNSSATATYLQSSSASITYAFVANTLSTTSAANTYLTQSSATATYLQLSSATNTYLQNSSASITYAFANNVLTNSSATATYLQLSSASVTYLNKLVPYVSSVNVTSPLTVTANGTAGSLPSIGITSISLSTGVIGLLPVANMTAGTPVIGSTGAIGISIDGGGSAIVAGSTRAVTVPYGCTISSWSVVADQSGSISVHVSSSSFSTYPTLVNMVGASGNSPSLTSQSSNTATPASWNGTSIAQGTIIAFVIDSASTVTWANIVLWLQKT